MFKKLFLIGAFAVPFAFSAQETSKQPKISIIPSVGYAWRTAKMPNSISNEQRD